MKSEVTSVCVCVCEILVIFFIHSITSRALVFVFFASFPKKTQQVNKLFFSIEFLGDR